MILRMPAYCRDFKCSAGACSDSCCIGWEIDIDPKTAEQYMSVTGEFGEKLRANIAKNDVYSFILKNERCPFLNSDNLCEIILNMGEDKLCHICDNHPRYYEWFDGLKEGGTGLCCEEAARLILNNGNYGEYYDIEIPDEPSDEYDEELYDFLFGARENLFAFLSNDKADLFSVVSRMLDYTEWAQCAIDNYAYDEVYSEITEKQGSRVAPDYKSLLNIFGDFEPIDEKWQPFIAQVKEKAAMPDFAKYGGYLRNIGAYFIWRYFMKGVFDEEILSKVKLAVIGMAVLGVVFTAENADEEQCIILAKNYSKEIEYSEENLEKLFDMTYTEDAFESEGLANLFRCY